jgi:hypothetical protein
METAFSYSEGKIRRITSLVIYGNLMLQHRHGPKLGSLFQIWPEVAM